MWKQGRSAPAALPYCITKARPCGNTTAFTPVSSKLVESCIAITGRTFARDRLDAVPQPIDSNRAKIPISVARNREGVTAFLASIERFPHKPDYSANA